MPLSKNEQCFIFAHHVLGNNYQMTIFVEHCFNNAEYLMSKNEQRANILHF